MDVRSLCGPSVSLGPSAYNPVFQALLFRICFFGLMLFCPCFGVYFLVLFFKLCFGVCVLRLCCCVLSLAFVMGFTDERCTRSFTKLRLDAPW